MKQSDLEWLRKTKKDPNVSINVVINGEVDEITDWIEKLLNHIDMQEKRATTVVNNIVEDLLDRSGLGDEWENIDDDIKEEIKKEWVKICIKDMSNG